MKLFEPSLYQIITRTPSPLDDHSQFDAIQSILSKGHQVYLDQQGNLITARRIHFREMQPGIYHRYGTTLVRDQDNSPQRNIDRFLMNERRVAKSNQTTLKKLSQLAPLIFDPERRSQSIMEKDMDQYFVSTDRQKKNVKIDRLTRQLGQDVLDERSARQYYIDKSQIADFSKEESEEKETIESRLHRIKEVSDQVLQKYFMSVKVRPKKKPINQIELNRLKQFQKQKAIEQFIKEQLLLDEQQFQKHRKKAQFKVVRSGFNKPRSIKQPPREMNSRVRRVRDQQLQLIKNIHADYQPKADQDFSQILKDLNYKRLRK